MKMSLRPGSVLAFAACTPASDDVGTSSAPPTVTEVTLTRDGQPEPLDDATVALVNAVPLDGCTPSVRILLRSHSDAYVFAIDLDAYVDGATVLSPSPPFVDRAPTLTLFDGGPPITLSGGLGTFSIRDEVHTLTLPTPSECSGRWREVDDPAACTPSPEVVLTFAGPIDGARWCSDGTAGDERDGAGVPYCVTQAATDRCP